ncbi:MAG: helix-hairpin-helix domain-containing protein [Pirellulales bacterium]|nr:helix-hairpin-helix domain-containing protein [Pirellulales bacterium]
MADSRQPKQPEPAASNCGEPRLTQARPRDWRPVLKRADQAVVAGLVLCAVAATFAHWVLQGGLRGEIIEIDRAEPLEARYVVDINSADWPELAELPQVGEILARRIVESRRVAGPFKDHGDLKRVQGIGPRTLEKLRPYLLPMPAQADVAAGTNVDANAL